MKWRTDSHTRCFYPSVSCQLEHSRLMLSQKWNKRIQSSLTWLISRTTCHFSGCHDHKKSLIMRDFYMFKASKSGGPYHTWWRHMMPLWPACSWMTRDDCVHSDSVSQWHLSATCLVDFQGITTNSGLTPLKNRARNPLHRSVCTIVLPYPRLTDPHRLTTLNMVEQLLQQKGL